MQELAGGTVSLNIPVGDTPEAGTLLVAVASAAVSTTSPVSESGFSKAAADEKPAHHLEGNMESLQDVGASGSGTCDKDSGVEGKLFVGGISWQTTEDGLRHYFSQYGTLMNVTIMKDKYTGHPRGFGFIKFDDVTVLDKIMAQEHKIDGKVVDVKRAVPKNEAPAPAPRTNKPPDSYKIFVGGLAPTVLMADIRKYFERFGDVADAVVMFDRQTQRSRGFGFVTFREESIIRVIMKSTHEIKGKMVEVKRAEPKESRSNRVNWDDKPCGPYPEKESLELAPFSGARLVQPSPGRGTGACYRMENSFANGNSNCAVHFVGVDAPTYSQMPYAYPVYGYNGQVYAAPTYCSRDGTRSTYGMEGISFPRLMPIHAQASYALQAQEQQPRYSQSDYVAALRNQQYAHHYAQALQRAKNVGVGVYFAQPY